MERIQALVEKFKRNECTDPERMEVLAYFEDHPGEWDRYLNEEDFVAFAPEARLDPAVSEKLLENVERRSVDWRRGGVKRWLVAASIIFVIATGWLISRTHREATDLKEVPGGPALASSVERKTNNTVDVETVFLEDGTEIGLFPQSTVQYEKSFLAKDQRVVYLTGKALFKVAKDKSRPFVVYSEEVATRVLGTSFTVTANPGSDSIKVVLHEGKVVVGFTDSTHTKLLTNEYLLPGDEYIFNRTTLAALVVHPSRAPDVGWAKAGSGRRLDGVKKPEVYGFNGLPLSQVLDQLSDYYQVDIYFHPSDLKNKYFAGQLEKTDSLDLILKDIALLNRLVVENKNGSWYFRRVAR